MSKILFIIILSFIAVFAFGQNISVHQEQSEEFSAAGYMTDHQYDSINGFSGRESFHRTSTVLQKRVFGYHPYWIGSAWQNYQWDLLSDLCYFSYEVNPANGEAVTIHDWNNAAVIDTAISRGVKVHLCVTLFSGHASFFGNPQAQQTLTNNLISLVASRGAHGINLDFEAVPSSQQAGLTNYIIQLSNALENALPEAELSIAAPAVNWSNTFDLPAITPWLDLIMVMAYDYYWNGSTLAGPVSGFWPLTSSFNYGVNRSLSYYQSQGVPESKLLLGLPYYGREWPVSSNTLPASTTGNGVAVTYRNIRANTTHYNPANYYWDYRSYNPYYSYFTSQWWQCFFDDQRSLGAKYDLVNRRGIAGIGIWALGYDNGYPELWNLIGEKFGDNPADLCTDTIYDSGGPWWSYENNETYTETIQSAWEGPLILTFNNLSLEAGFDSLWIYDGINTDAPVIAALSGNEIPSPFLTSGNVFTLKFSSDNLTSRAGYELVWSCPTTGIDHYITPSIIEVFPVPAKETLNIRLAEFSVNPVKVSLTSLSGSVIYIESYSQSDMITLSVGNLASGVYVLVCEINGKLHRRKIIIMQD
jgi:spore germination protein YaaH